MPTTGSPWNLFYPASTDDVRPYEDIQSLATSVAAALTALVLNMAPHSATDTTSRTTSSVGYTTTLAPAGLCGVSFTAPPSGNVMIIWEAYQVNSGVGYCLTSFRIAAGSTVGAGATVLGESDDRTLQNTGTGADRGSAHYLVTGLTAGTVYNVTLYHGVQSGTATLLRRDVTVIPLIA